MMKFLASLRPDGLYRYGAANATATAGGFAAPAPDCGYDVSRPRARQSARGGFYRRVGKRACDLAFLFCALPFALPVIALGALALRLEGGSVFYRQDRLGRSGQVFSILKLRTMVADADAVLEACLARDPQMRAEWDRLQKLHNDPRITPVGKFLRATSLDELPQLWNVLTGDMTVVGPRPMMPCQRGMYGDPAHYDALRPGITGLWQVSARNSNTFGYRNEVDATYARGLSLGADLAILVRTVSVVLRRTGV